MSPQDAARFTEKWSPIETGARNCRTCQRERWARVERDRPSVPCPSCGRRLRPKNLRDHVRKLHPMETEA